MQLSTAPVQGIYWTWRDQQLYYVKAGDRTDRPPIILIHGFGASTDHWRKNIAELQKEFEVWAVDLMGFGRSAKPNWQYSGDVWRDQLHDFIQNVVERPAVLAGNSLGGYSALCTAAHHPESVAGLVLLNSAGPFSESPETQNRPNPAQQAFQSAVRSFMLQPLPSWMLFQYVRRKSTIRRVLNQVYLDKTAVTDELVEEIYRPSCDPGAAQVFASVFKTRKGETVDQLLHQLNRPLLMLWGEGDPWMNTRDRSAKFRQHYPELTEHFLQAGHCPHDEVPHQVDQLMQNWILRTCTEAADKA
jgi:pimeloyl-ACP methyl ester carboxylesterase